MKRKIFVWAVSALLICSAERTNAGVIYSNLGPGGSFDTIDELDILGAGKGNTVVATQFTAAISGQFSDALVAMGLRSGTNEVLVSLETDSGGVPGAILESIDVVGA